MALKHLKWLLILLVAVILSTLTASYFWLQGSLPQLQGQHSLPYLSQAVTVNRDQSGIPFIKGKNKLDVAQALGFLHGQERYFQMDLARRNSAGELSELFGSALIDYDKERRIHRLRHYAEGLLNRLSADHRNHLEQYVKGVNQGLNGLSTLPFEYILLNDTPKPWTAVDSVLVVFGMYLTLQEDNISEDDQRTQLQALLPNDIFTFFTALHSPWQSTLNAVKVDAPSLPTSDWPILPDASDTQSVAQDGPKNAFGSNNWAIGKALTNYQSGMLANDMHLGISVPNIWFRASMSWQSPSSIELHGVTLPGIPGIVVGSNTHIAWGFTNSYADLTDTIYLTTNDDKTRYITQQGEFPFKYISETIHVKGGESVSFDIQQSQWGPVVNQGEEQLKAIHWVAYSDNAINLKLSDIAEVKTVAEALDIAPLVGIPTQNLVVTDSLGNIGWTLVGPLLKRLDHDGRFAINSIDIKARQWAYLPPEDYPYILNPDNHRIWTANAPVLAGSELEKIGLGPYAHSARGKRIETMLAARDNFSESDLMAIQLDTTNDYFLQWQQYLLKQLAHYKDPENAKLSAQLRSWSGQSGDVAGHIIQMYQWTYRGELLSHVVDYLQHYDDSFSRYSLARYRDIPWVQLLAAEADNLLPPTFSDWPAFHQHVNQLVLEYINENNVIDDQVTLATITSSLHQHPMSRNVPLIGLLLDMPSVPLSGSKYTPNVDSNGFGASERLVVAPGHEEQGILQMPSSQTAHPLSPYYGAAHKDWAAGIATPLLPQESKYELTLNPQ